MFLECDDNISDLIINKHHLIKKDQIYCLEKLNIRELYNIQLILNVEKPTAQKYFKKNFKNLGMEMERYGKIGMERKIDSTIFGFIDHKENCHLINHTYI